VISPEVSSRQEPVAVGSVTGKLGFLELVDSGTTYVQSKYGQYCAGQTCTGTQDYTECNNYVIMKAGYQEGGPTTGTFRVTVTMTDKVGHQSTLDWDCPPPQGPPKWSATTSITVKGPVQKVPAPDPPQTPLLIGAVSQAFSHTSISTSWTLNKNNGGSGYADQQGGGDFTHTFDPNQPGSYLEIGTGIKVTFNGSAEEIDVLDSSLKMTIKVEMTVL
jgi:hypothetical protein